MNDDKINTFVYNVTQSNKKTKKYMKKNPKALVQSVPGR